MPLSTVYVYCDASFSKSHGVAVIGYSVFRTQTEHDNVLLQDKEIVFCEIEETNNIRAEIRGALAALEGCPSAGKIFLYTDCQTVVDLPRRREKLERTNFISETKGRELTNTELYRKFYKLYDRARPEIVWIKGHTSKKVTNSQKNFSFLDKAVRKKLRLYTK
jgi:ribonuclease HI